MKVKSIKAAILKFAKNPKKFGTATTESGLTLQWEGDLNEGVVVTLEDGTAAPEGSHTVILDGAAMVITLDANGVVTSIALAEEMAIDEEVAQGVAEAIEAIVEPFRSQLAEMTAKLTEATDKLAAFEAKIKEFEAKFPEQKKEPKEAKFHKNPFVNLVNKK